MRVVVATHRNLEQLVETGEFRRDLFHPALARSHSRLERTESTQDGGVTHAERARGASNRTFSSEDQHDTKIVPKRGGLILDHCTSFSHMAVYQSTT